MCSDDNVISFWGTRNGIPEMGSSMLVQDSEVNTHELGYLIINCNIICITIPKEPQSQVDLELGNNTAAFTNFLASVYKSELILEPQDLLGHVIKVQM